LPASPRRPRLAGRPQLLSVVDYLERALAAAEPRNDDGAANHIAEGVRLVYEELSGVLANSGVESYEPTGEQFDPDQHEAVMTRPDGPEHAGKHRLLHTHRNVPGMLAAMNAVLAAAKINIASQYLETSRQVGYAVIDVDGADRPLSATLRKRLDAIEGTIRTRVLY